MDDLKEVKQLKSKVKFDLEEDEGPERETCKVVLMKGKRVGELCGNPMWGNPKCEMHMAADRRKTMTTNPFTKALKEGPPQKEEPFTIKGDETFGQMSKRAQGEEDSEEEENEEDEEEEDLQQIDPYKGGGLIGGYVDPFEEITVSLKNVKEMTFKIIRRR